MKACIFVSPCLLGEKCRYDGCSKPNKGVQKALCGKEYVCACPEVLGGLPTPRKPSEICGDRVLMVDGTDVTANYKSGAEKALEIALARGCKIAILKARSPSCGKGYVYDGTYTGTLRRGNGITAQLFIDNGITVLDETEIDKLIYEDYSK